MDSAKKVLKRTRYENQHTGEIFDKKMLVEPLFDEEKGYLFKNKTHAIRQFLDRPFPSSLSWSEQGRLGLLKHYMLSDNQFLVHRSSSAMKPISMKDICKIVNMSDRQSRTFIKKAKEAGVLKEVVFDGLTYYAFNPIYALKARRVSLTLFVLFQDELKQALPPWVVAKFLEQANELKPNIEIVK